MPKKKGLRDLILFFAFGGVPIASFLLQDFPNAQFFTILLVVFMGLLIWLRQYHKEESFKKFLDYDENMGLKELGYVVLGILGSYVSGSLIIEHFAISSIYVPFAGMSLDFGSFQLSGMWNDFLFNVTLVAPAEELCKLVLHLAFYIKLHGFVSEPTDRVLAVAVPIGLWSLLHVYVSYSGPNMVTLLGAAFVGGLIIFAVMWKTKSLLGAILAHGGYNCLVVWIMVERGMYPASLSPSGLALLMIVGVLLLGGVSLIRKVKYRENKRILQV